MLKIVIKDISILKHSLLQEIVLKLPAYRQNKINSLKEEKTKLQSILAGLIIHEEFGDLDKKITLNEFGKEIIEGKYFSVSHSDSKVMVVFSDKEVGCDIQRCKKVDINIAKKFFNENEYDEIQKCRCPNKQFIKYWTIKEATLKCLGVGLNQSLKSVMIKDSKLISDEVELIKIKKIRHYIYSICVRK